MDQEFHRIPIATYRWQFNQSFTFKDATALIPYLHALGISHCYASPYLKAKPGSSHGYDVVDPSSLNPEIGTDEEYLHFVRTLQAHHMGQILDVVPNHMGISEGWNPWWQDVLENGPSSRYARFFDIDWHPVKAELNNKVLLPILGDQYGIVLENKEITLCYAHGQFDIEYYQHRLPLDPTSWVLVLSFDIDDFLAEADPADLNIQELQSIITALGNLPLRHELDPNRTAERYREIDVIKRRLDVLSQESSLVFEFIKKNLETFNGNKGHSRGFDLLDALLSDQSYRLAYWRVASEEINYRRFFDINELAAIRTEDEPVFQEIHSRVFDLLKQKAVSGLRIDHVDGLYHPKAYLTQWQDWATKELGSSPDPQGQALYLIVEKILSKGETLSEEWPIHGTSGYEFMGLINTLFIDPSNRRAFDNLYVQFAKQGTSLDELIYASKKLIMNSAMSSEINALGNQLNVLSEQQRRSRDFTLNNLIHAIREIIACFPVYRTYISPNPEEGVTDRDRAYIRLAVTKAKRKNPATNALVFDFIQDLLLKIPDSATPLKWSKVHPFVMKFQQTTSPVMAKGEEDTAFYIYNRLISLNEVGSDPSQFGLTVPGFHERLRARQTHWPHGLSATSTHDTKRSEDVRARINVLSELPKEWKGCITRWHRLNKKKKLILDDVQVPDPNDEYALYQTLLGVWPLEPMDDQALHIFQQRIQGYMNKALKEAKVHTSWINPNEQYEQAVSHFIEKILDRNTPNPFLDDFLSFQDKIAYFGMINSLSQVVLKITAPGIPDFYQGTELWTLTLVDPDNRQPVDYQNRLRLLEELNKAEAGQESSVFEDLVCHWKDGRLKFYITMVLLRFRKKFPQLFSHGAYIPLESYGEKSDYICGYQRQDREQDLLILIPRFLTSLGAGSFGPFVGETVWGNTHMRIPSEDQTRQFRDILTGHVVMAQNTDGELIMPLAQIFQLLPIAILERVP